MSVERHPLTLQVEEIFIGSSLTPKINFLLLEGMDAYFKRETIEISEDLPRLVKKLYAIGDNEVYAILSVCHLDQYKAVLMPLLIHFIRDSGKEVISSLRESEELNGESLANMVREVNEILKAALDILRNSIVSKRRAIGTHTKKEVEYPDFGTLEAFYKCGRKVQYASPEEAESNLMGENSVYICPYGPHYHQGRAVAQKAPPIPEGITLSRYQTVWRRHHKI